MGAFNYIASIRRGLRRPEIRRHPVKAITRRLQWRLHWKRSSDPIVIENWWRNLKIALPNTGNAAHLFYRTHSDQTMVWLLQALLSPRMTFVDVGAHIGEYTLIGAKMVGSEGRVVAVEPLPPCVEAIRRNASINGLSHVQVHDGALCGHTGTIGFQSDPQRSAGWIASKPDQIAFEARCWTLEDFFRHAGITKANVIKLDANGNEISVLRGGEKLLRNGGIGTMVMKFYNPDVIRERFGYDTRENLSLLCEWGFQLKLIVGQEAFPIFSPDDVNPHFDSLVYCHLLVATHCRD